MRNSEEPVERAERTKIKAVLSLVLVSFLALFLELALIRWIPGVIKIVGYYTNLVLISSFLGLGLGCAAHSFSSSREDGHFQLPFRLLASALAYLLMQRLGMGPQSPLWGEKYWFFPDGILPPSFIPMMVFILNTWCFLPLGRWLGRSLDRFTPLPGYSLNLAGSLAGVITFTMFSVTETPSLIWFIVAGGFFFAWIMTENHSRRGLVVTAAVWAVLLAAIYAPDHKSIWSPYYKITMQPWQSSLVESGISPETADSIGLTYLLVNHDIFQFAVNPDPDVHRRKSWDDPELAPIIDGLSDYFYYVQAPYQLRPPGRVLILGSGLGNDVAAALRNHAGRIDAVEIDPVIARLGRKIHPERPYADERVTLHVTDARRFLKRAHGPYELIVFSFLDSHTLFSAYSSVRLDNFVYTEESFREVARLLSDDGVIVVMFASPRDFIGKRLFHLLRSIHSESVQAWALRGKSTMLWVGYDIIAAGPGLLKHKHRPVRFEETTTEYIKREPPALPTDDWPFLYLAKRLITPGYALTLAALLAISFVFTRRVVPQARGLKPHFFLLGAGFLLLETKSITELSLLFGSTWMINSAVISAFLVMGMLGALIAAKAPLPKIIWIYALLGAAILVNFIIPVQKWLLPGVLSSAILASAVVALPVLFSGIIFAASFKHTAAPALALGSNIIGAVAGGILEYSSMIAGFKSLYLIAALIYLGAYFFRKK
jgi:SAM-dependent methyltransferase